jgi:molybdate transport system substrate-binding protein
LIRGVLVCACLWLAVGIVAAAEIQVAVASNFSRVVGILAARFEATTGHRVAVIPGSTGKHYAQIRNGAPFDLFLAADALHPRRLEERGLAIPGSRFTYAFGRLVLWSPREDYVDDQGEVLENGEFRHLGIANPGLAPYGRAAREALESLGIWEGLQDRLVRGENIGQAFQFVASGNAELGFVALSQVMTPEHGLTTGSIWRVPQELYTPIEQQAILVRDNAAAREFMDFLESAEARLIIRDNGYRSPQDEAH